MSKKQSNFVSEETLLKQQFFLQQIQETWSKDFLSKYQRKPAYFLETYGCQMNERDTLHLKGMLELAGFCEASSADEADFILFNTCCIRDHAEKRVFGNIGALNKRKLEEPDLIIGVCGCMMQQEKTAKALFKRFPYVNFVFGTHVLYRFPEILFEVLVGKQRIIEIEASDGIIAEKLPEKRNQTATAYVTIMYGCNNYCSYCVVPYVRGRERSRDVVDIEQEIQRRISEGAKEITLLGQNVNSYGLDTQGSLTFAQLLERVDNIEGIERIRFMSSHPKDLSDELVDVMAKSKHVCHHIHLPVQSGSNAVLQRMNRKYTREDYLLIVQKLQQAMPSIEITTDFIVGFPGETQADFEQTLALVEEVGFAAAFTFMYSSRPGTAAASWQDQIPEELKKERLLLLNEIQNKITSKSNLPYIEKTFDVLVEGNADKSPSRYFGRTNTFKSVVFEGENLKIGDIVPIYITSSKLNALQGKMQII